MAARLGNHSTAQRAGKARRVSGAAAPALLVIFVLFVLAGSHPLHSQAASPQSPRSQGLTIVVLEGEGAVNIIQQKTAVAPVVEVRDRNDQPVAGAVVTFAIRSGRATFNGARTLTLTTNAAGRAAVTGLTPTGSGALQISASAAFEGQAAATTITQSNVMTAAQAASAGSGSTAGGTTTAPGTTGTGATATAGGTAAGGGGISGVAVAGIAAAVGGGAIVAVKATGGGDKAGGNGGASAGGGSGAGGGTGGGSSGGSGGTSAGVTYSGSFSGQWQVATTTASANQSTTCVSTRAVDGALAITLDRRSDIVASGTARLTGNESEISVTASAFCSAQPGTTPVTLNVAITGTVNAMGFSFTSSGSGPTPNGGGTVTCTETTMFDGALAGGVVSGNVTRSRTCQGSNIFNGVSSTINGNGSGTFAVTLR